MSLENFMMKLFVESVNAMDSNDWHWPDSWNSLKKQQFLGQSMIYAEKNELYEQCIIIKKIQTDLETA